MEWLIENKEWLFGGIGIAMPLAIISWLFFPERKTKIQKQKGGHASRNIQASGDIKIDKGPTVSVTTLGDGSPTIGVLYGDVIIQKSAKDPLEWKEAFNNLPPSQNAQDDEPFATRTFSIFREKGATFTLGPCPSAQCMIFELGEFHEKNGFLIQDIFLHGGGFDVKTDPKSLSPPGKAKLVFQMTNLVRLTGAAITPFLTPAGEAAGLLVSFQLHRNSSFTIYTRIADVQITTSDIRVDRLQLKVEVRSPSNGSK